MAERMEFTEIPAHTAFRSGGAVGVPQGHVTAMNTIDARLEEVRNRAAAMRANVKTLADAPAVPVPNPSAPPSVVTITADLAAESEAYAAAIEAPALSELSYSSASSSSTSPGSTEIELSAKVSATMARTSEIERDARITAWQRQSKDAELKRRAGSLVIDPAGVYKGSRTDVDPAEVEEAKKLSVLDSRIEKILARNRQLRSHLEDEPEAIVVSNTTAPADFSDDILQLEQTAATENPIVPAIEQNAAAIKKRMESIAHFRSDKAKTREVAAAQAAARIALLSKAEREREEKNGLAKALKHLSHELAAARNQLHKDNVALDRAKAASASLQDSLAHERVRHAGAHRDMQEFCTSRGISNPFRLNTVFDEAHAGKSEEDIELEFARLVEETNIMGAFEHAGVLENVNTAFDDLLRDTGSVVPAAENVHVFHQVGLPPQPYLVLYNYDPHKQSPNPDPQEELHLVKGEIIGVTSDLSGDGFYVGEKKGDNGELHSGLVAHTFVELVAAGGAADAIAEEEEGQEPDEVVDDFVLVDNDVDAAAAEEALDYVVVGGLSDKEKREAERSMRQTKDASFIEPAVQPGAGWRPKSAKGKGKGKSKQLTQDPVLKKRLNVLKQQYSPMVIKKFSEKRAYGARPPPFEIFVINDVKVTIWNKGTIIVVKDHNYWVPFDRFFRQFGILHGLERIEHDPVKEDYPKKIKSMETMINATKRDTQDTAENANGDIRLEKTKAEVLKGKISLTKEKLVEERDGEDAMLVELQSRNGALIETRNHQRKNPKSKAIKAKIDAIHLHFGGEKTKTKLSIDEAITVLMMDVLETFPDTVFKPTENTVSGNFRTFLINGQSCLLSCKGGQVMARYQRDWIDIWGLLAKQEADVELMAERRRQRGDAAGLKAKAAEDIENEARTADSKLKYKELADEYARSKRVFEQTQTTGASAVNQEAETVEMLEAELRQLEQLQKAARARNHFLLDNMEKKNHAILGEIADADKKVQAESAQDVVYRGHMALTDMQNEAKLARTEYEKLKVEIDKSPIDLKSSKLSVLAPVTGARNVPIMSPAPKKVDIDSALNDLDTHANTAKAAENELDALFASVEGGLDAF